MYTIHKHNYKVMTYAMYSMATASKHTIKVSNIEILQLYSKCVLQINMNDIIDLCTSCTELCLRDCRII